MLRFFSVIRKHSIITLPERPKVMRTPYSDGAQMLMSGWQLLQTLCLSCLIPVILQTSSFLCMKSHPPIRVSHWESL